MHLFCCPSLKRGVLTGWEKYTKNYRGKRKNEASKPHMFANQKLNLEIGFVGFHAWVKFACQAADRKRSLNEKRHETFWLSQEVHFLPETNIKAIFTTEIIAVTYRSSLVLTVLDRKCHTGSESEDPTCCKPRIKDNLNPCFPNSETSLKGQET